MIGLAILAGWLSGYIVAWWILRDRPAPDLKPRELYALRQWAEEREALDKWDANPGLDHGPRHYVTGQPSEVADKIARGEW